MTAEEKLIQMKRRFLARILLRIRENKRKIRILELMNKGSMETYCRMKQSLVKQQNSHII